MELPRGEAITCEDARTGFIDHMHDGKESGPAGEFYVIMFDSGPEWQPADHLYKSLEHDKNAWLAVKIAEAKARSDKAALDNVAVPDEPPLPKVV